MNKRKWTPRTPPNDNEQIMLVMADCGYGPNEVAMADVVHTPQPHYAFGKPLPLNFNDKLLSVVARW